MQKIKDQSPLAKKLAQKASKTLSNLPLKFVKKDKGIIAPVGFGDNLQAPKIKN